MSLDIIAERMRTKVAESGFDRSVKFDCGDDGTIVIDGSRVTTGEGEAECTIRLDKQDLEAMIDGELDPTSAFMQGRLKVEGDMSVAMALTQVI